MIYIAESGSTKCDAVFLNDDGSEHSRLRTMGFNPYFHSAEFIDHEIRKVAEIEELGNKVTKVFFFGAGCSTPELNAIVGKGLQGGFPNAEITVDHDLTASAYATYDSSPAVTCILGTGSNCVYFDGKNIQTGVSGLGYILGDEGSASYIGKKLLAAYLYEQMPEEARADFESTYKLSKEEIRIKVYNKPHVNVFLGSFAPFAHKHLSEKYFYDLVYATFRDFVEVQVLHFPEAKNVTINFVGSIAYHFEGVLQDVLRHLDLKLGVIIRRPIDGLVNYCRQHL